MAERAAEAYNVTAYWRGGAAAGGTRSGVRATVHERGTAVGL
jgi:hypothetical protein